MPRIKQIVGLDIGSRQVRAAWVSVRGQQPVVTRTEQLALPPDAQNRVEIIRAWINKCGLSRQFCAIALSGGNTVFQAGKIAKKDPRTPRQVAAVELAAFSDMAGDAMSYDITDHTMAADSENRYYLMAMARPAAIERALSLASQIGVRPADLIPAPVAIYNRLTAFVAKESQPVIYIDIGHNQTEVAVGDAAGILFARAVPIGGKAFTDVLAQGAGITPHQAEVRKHAEGLADETASLLKPATDRWLVQVSSCLSVYRSTFTADGMAPQGIVLSGGGTDLSGLREVIGERFSMRVTMATELPGFTESGGATCRMAGGFCLAVGLAVTALELGASHISLLPGHLRDEVVFRDKKPYWIAASVCGALTLAIFTISGLRSLKREERLLHEERQRLRAREQIDKQIGVIRSRGDALRWRSQRVRDLLQNAPVSREALTLAANSLGADDWLTLFCNECCYVPQEGMPKPSQGSARPTGLAGLRSGAIVVAPPKAARKKATQPKKSDVPQVLSLSDATTQTFIIEGYTADPSWDSVKNIIERLRTSPTVINADIRADDRVLPPEGGNKNTPLSNMPVFRRFVISMEVKCK